MYIYINKYIKIQLKFVNIHTKTKWLLESYTSCGCYMHTCVNQITFVFLSDDASVGN